VGVYDTRVLLGSGPGPGPVTAFTRGVAGVEDLVFLEGSSLEGGGGGGGEVDLAVATADGLPYVARVGGGEGQGVTLAVAAELVGADCDPVRCVRVRGAAGGGWDVWSAGDDAVVRRWRWGR